jgi:hypothetical protein
MRYPTSDARRRPSTGRLALAGGRALRTGLLLLALAAAMPAPFAGAQAARAAAPRADTSFAATIARLSEPGGFFDTDNLISNEGSYLQVMGRLQELGVKGGAYVGVGPDQSFSYIAQIRPSVAVLVDIRRDNLLEHLLFKALFALSRDRLEYLALLTGRPVPAVRAPGEGVDQIVAYIDRTPMQAPAFEEAHRRVEERIRSFGVPVAAAEWETIRRFHAAFAQEGLDLQFESFGRAPQSYYPNLRQLIVERDLQGRLASYLASDDAFQFVRSLQLRNRVIPVVGDLAGERALPAIARYLRDRGETLSAYYISNVDFYLAEEGKLDRFMANVKQFPRDGRSVIIRSVFSGPARIALPQASRWRSAQLLQSVDTLVREYDAGHVRGYYDLVTVGSLEVH